MQLKKMWLNINGANRMFICDPEKDSLADVLRRLGLTGTKVGCHQGMCGVCSVILDGKVIRSCTKRIISVPEYAKVLTIEGIGTPGHLHPLQQAWITYGGVQCGICTPGFIMSAYALLAGNPSPTREQVRDWFRVHRNACRCTGYKPLVDAVMEAAKVMRGEASVEEITYSHPKEAASYYDTRLPRPSAVAKVCGLLDYGEDVTLKMPPETLHIAIVQPCLAHHANILAIDTSEAEKMPGVVKIVTAKDVQGNNLMNQYLTHKRALVKTPNRPILASNKIYRYGDAVAAVIADTREHAREAAKYVHVQLERLPEYLSYPEAVAPDAIQIHAESPNIYLTQPVVKGKQADAVIDSSQYYVEGSFRTPREPHLSIEGDIVQAYMDEDGIMTIHCKSQAIKLGRSVIAKGIGLDEEKVRFVHNGVGGSFGWSTNATSYAITAICAMAVNRPVSLVMSYQEFMHFSGKRTPSHINSRLACDENGFLTALEYDAGIDHGAYSEMADSLMHKFATLGGPYSIPNVSGIIRTAYTNHNVGVAYRGYGYPQSGTAMEAMMDMLAEKAGIDPFEFRYQNLLKPGETTVNGFPLHEYVFQNLMQTARPHYYTLKQHAAQTSTEEKRRGVGVVCSMFKPCIGPFDHCEVELELMPDNSVTNYNTWEDMGQGGDIGSLVLTLEALKPLGLKPEQVNLHMNDSKECPDSGIAASSRSHFMGGNAVIDASNKLLAAMRKPDGTYRTYNEMKADNIPTRYKGIFDLSNRGLFVIDPNTGMGDPSPTGMYGVCMAEVEVDIKTGKTKVLEMTMWADAGIIGNKLAAEGQAYGGMSHCIGYALSEDYDDVKKHDNIIRAGMPFIEDIPDNFNIHFIETPRESGPFGSAGLAELFQSTEHMAVINGIYHATGVRVYELPAYPEKVKAGLDRLKNGQPVLPPDPYYLGPDMYDVLEDIRINPV